MAEDLKKHTFDYGARDRYYWQRLEQLKEEEGMSLQDMLMNWPTYVRRRELPRFLAHYEMFKHVIDLPGCVVECGVFKGASFFTWTKLMETFCPGDRYRKVYGFDHFEGLTDFNEKDGAHVGEYFDKQVGGWKASAHHARVMTHLVNDDTMMPGLGRCELIEGNVLESIPKFLASHPGLRISLLYLDMDIYEPTKAALEAFYPLVVKGGVVALDEYGLQPWEGESRAAEEYFASIGEAPTWRKFPTAILPSGYFIK
jgi:hypothetical protein